MDRVYKISKKLKKFYVKRLGYILTVTTPYDCSIIADGIWGSIKEDLDWRLTEELQRNVRDYEKHI